MKKLSRIFNSLQSDTSDVSIGDFVAHSKDYIAKNISVSLIFTHDTCVLELDSGMRMYYVDRYNSASPVIATTGNYEPEVSKYILDHLPEKGTFIDIGANQGWYSLLVAYNFPSAQVIAFEPGDNAYEDLVKNIQLNDLTNIQKEKLALSSSSTPLYISKDHYASNYVITKKTPQHSKVNSTMLDEYLARNDFKGVDLIKCDVEGWEYEVFRGALKTIRKYRPIVISELIDNPTQSFGYRKDLDAATVIDFFEDEQYKTFFIDDEGSILPHKDLGKGCIKSSFHNYIFEPA